MPLSTTSPSPARSTPSSPLPDEILHTIASFSEEKEVWRMMASSRALRQAAEPALKSFLAERVIVQHFPNPPSVNHHYPWVNKIIPYPRNIVDHCARHTRFDEHLAAYPSSASLLRRLVIEVSHNMVGWDLIGRMSKQLDGLALYTPVQEGDSPPEPENHGWLPPSLGPKQLPKLTSLAIMSKELVHHHLPFLIRIAPKLRDLTIGCVEATCGFNPLPDMPNLERLALSGTQQRRLYQMCASVQRRAPALRYLILSLSLDALPPNPWQTDWVHASTLKPSQVDGVALYGFVASTFGSAQSGVQFEDAKWAAYAGLKTLVLEEQRQWRTDTYPLLFAVTRPLLPAIKRIIWVDCELDIARRSEYSLIPLRPYDNALLGRLFEEYPTLEHVQWVNDYPADPFAEDYGTSFLDKHLIRRVDRADVFA